ncbi:MAG: branched-chain amino acid ABC transporter ATP-binding protein/permease [Treponema sp.]|jgi:branched-chain amino acid transport system ATP-binding protein|nr:branched-chain amino acid ABC transporter ATP-binding protein/permease [Treponema sp.]
MTVIRRIVRHPFFGFIIFGLALIGVQFLQRAGVVQYSFAKAMGQTAIYGIIALGFSFLLGYAGLSSLGTAGFVGLGAYITALFLNNYTGVPFTVVLILVLVISIGLGAIVGFISLRIEGIFLAIVTLGLAEVLRQVFINAMDLTGGSNGMKTGVLRLFPGLLDLRADLWTIYYIIVAVLVALMMLTSNLVRSPTGRAMLAMKNSTSAAQAMGISLLKYRLLAFVLATAYAGAAGCLHIVYGRYTDPNQWTIVLSLNVLAACLVGGSKSIWGVLTGALIIFGLTPMFLQDVAILRNNSWVMSEISGLLIILVVIFYRGGLAQLVNRLLAVIKARLKPDSPAQADIERIKKETPAEVVWDLKAAVDAGEMNVKKNRKNEAFIERMKSPDFALPGDVALRLDNLSMYFGGLHAVDGLSFDVKKGEIFGLIGPNGAGKTTVFNCITQFYKPTKGDVWFKDAENRTFALNSFAVHDVIKTGIVRTFQNIELVTELTILENILVAAHTQYETGFFAHMFATPSLKRENEQLTQKALGVLKQMRLLHLKDEYPVGLPYGILKRIELARTLMANASLIILDEPAAGLNDTETTELATIAKQIASEYKITVFLVEHDMGLVMDICDHICAISFGKKLAYGTPREIQNDKVVQEAYLGVDHD